MPAISVPALLNALPDPVLLADGDGYVTAANPAARDLLGAGVLGLHLRAVFRQPEVSTALDRVARDGGAAEADILFSGESTDTRWRVTLHRAESGGWVVSLRDVSEIVAAEAQRRDFVANVSHELRSPLTVLAGFIETLQGTAGADPDTRAEFLDIMAQEAARMTGLVADLLSLSRVENTQRIRPRDPVSPEAVVRATVAALRPQAEAAGVRVDLDLPGDLPEVPGDHDQLVQVFCNLLENALKYGARGGRVEISGTQLAQVAGIDGPALRIRVQDWGEGVDPVFIPRLTERFFRVDKARSRESGGTGLGLAIVKHIVARHRGRLVIRSQPGQGASFDVLLPRAPQG